jgi:predicted RNase H-like HicB family nuclease
MRYKIALYRSDEGASASVPGLPGCWSQGRDEAEAVDDIRETNVVDEQLEGADVREIDVAI